jgi:hypothetical protein
LGRIGERKDPRGVPHDIAAYTPASDYESGGREFESLRARQITLKTQVVADVGTKEADAANALIKFLKTPEAIAVFKARGLKPA